MFSPIYEGEVLTPKTYEVNLARMYNELYELVKRTGGYFVDATKYNHDIFLDQFQNRKHYSVKNRNGEIFPVKYQSSDIQFVLHGIYYSFFTQDNIFFPAYLIKTTVFDGGKKIQNCYADELSIEDWQDYTMWHVSCTDEDVKRAANRIFHMIVVERGHSKPYSTETLNLWRRDYDDQNCTDSVSQ